MSIHKNFSKGKKLLIILKDGSHIIDKYVETRGRLIKFLASGDIPITNIRSLTIYKGC